MAQEPPEQVGQDPPSQLEHMPPEQLEHPPMEQLFMELEFIEQELQPQPPMDGLPQPQ